jgi:branched-chain amino acid transport system ATP-binding protein
MTPLLSVDDLTVDYGGNRAVEIDSFRLTAGSLTCVAGANGAGKTTLINALVGWSRGRPRVTARIELAGQDISRLAAHERARAGMLLVPEGQTVFSTLTVAENLAAVLPPPAKSGRRGFSLDEIFDLFPRLAERRQNLGSALSGGERGMLAVARALRAGPCLLLLDEPSIGLAPRLVGTLLSAVRRLVDGGLTVLLVEQNVRAALDVADRLLLLERGRIIAAGTASEMASDRRVADAYLGSSHG